MSKEHGRGPIDRRRRRKAVCGVCGHKKLMTRAHVPPQCAGNQMLTKRYRLMLEGHEVSTGRPDPGGIHLPGHCIECNGLASRYDGAYGDFAASLKPCWDKSLTLALPKQIAVPDIGFAPGAVARSILLGMCATGTLLREHWPDLPMSLTRAEPVELPAAMKLYLALARGRSARVAGSIFGWHLLGPNQRRGADGNQIGIMAIASVYFPPLAWELVYTARETILDELGWVDVSGWTRFRPEETHRLRQMVPKLAPTCHPWHDPCRNDSWTELFNSDMVHIIECGNIEGGEPDPALPLTFSTRAYMPTGQMLDLARQRGVVPTTGT
jgi:hypothetical protein